MGRKTDALLGRSFKPAKFKPLIKVAMTRLSVVKNQHQVRLSQARSDIVQLLNLGHHERALLRVEQVIKEQNMLDVLVMMESYCLLLIERISLIEHEKECPDELKEVISSLIYAASRSGELPEVQEIRAVLTSRYGKEFAARAIELRNNCGVDHRIIQKLSTRMPSLESRMVALKEIASENGITLQLEDTPEMAEEKIQSSLDQNQPKPDPAANSNSVKVGDGLQMLPELIERDEGFSGSVKTKKYRDVGHAAQAAFESAAYAAAAARAAVELSRADSHDPGDQNSPRPRQRKLWDTEELMKSKSETAGEKESGMGEKSDIRSEFEKVDLCDNYDPESGDEEIHETSQDEESKPSDNAVELKESSSSSSGTSDVLEPPKPLGKEIAFEGRDDENVNNQHDVQSLKTSKFGFRMKPSLLKIEEHNSAANDPLPESGEKLHYLSHKQMYTRYQARMNVAPGHGNSVGDSAEGSGIRSAHALNIEKKPFSMRTGGVHVR